MSDIGTRNLIRTEINNNFFVEAGAGSGKTSMLVDRLVAMVENGVPIDKICAITFTKAAASEFYYRFQEKLSQSDEEAAKNALRDIDLCFMGTIDSFCNMALSEHPVEAKVPTNISIVSDAELMEEYRRFLSEIATGNYNGLRKKYDRAIEIAYNADQIITELVAALMDMRNVDFHFNPPKDGTVDELYAAEIQRIREIVKHLDEHPEARTIKKVEKHSDAAWENISDYRVVLEKDWNDNIDRVVDVLKSIHSLRVDNEYDMNLFGLGWEKFFTAKDKTTKSRGYEIEYYTFDKENDSLLLQRVTEHKYSVIIDLAYSSIEPIQEKLRKEGKLSYFDYLLYFRDLLKKDITKGGRVIKHLQERYKYYLIDEFQDTNPLQAEVFFYLTAEELKENWMDCKPMPGSLFVVGDPKQSIYRFRNADIDSYKTVKDLFKNGVGEVVELTSNYRSNSALKGWFNDVFSNILIESDIQAGFSPIPDSAGYNIPFNGVLEGVYKYQNKIIEHDEDQNIIETEVKDEYKVSEIINTLVENDQITINVKEISENGGEEVVNKAIAYKDIMVLTKTKTGIKDLMLAMKREGIPFRVAGDVLFSDCPALRTVVYLMRDIAYNSYSGKDEKRYENDKSIGFYTERLSDVDYDIKKYYRKEITPAALFSLLLDHEKILAKSGTENMEYLYYAEELLRTKEIDGSVYSLKSAVDFLEGLLLSGKNETEKALQLNPTQDAVYISNLHKVKGLEAPIVILAHPSKQDKSITTRKTLTDGYLFALKAKNSERKYNYIETGAYDEEKDKEQEVIGAEEERLLYVAATRAMNALIVASKTNKPDKNGIVRESKNNPWATLAEEIDVDITEAVLFPCRKTDDKETETILNEEDVEKLYNDAEKDSIIETDEGKRKEQNAASFKLERPSTLKRTHSKLGTDSSLADDDVETNDAPYKNTGDVIDRSSEKEAPEEKKERKYRADVIGTMVHRFMEIMVSSKAAADVELVIKSIILEQKDNFSADEDYYTDILKTVSDTIVNRGGFKQDSDVPQDILYALVKAKDIYCEMPFCYSEESTAGTIIWHGVMDVVYRDEKGWHILDYKTNRDADNLDKKYEDQLDAYVKAFKEITGEDADAKIYSIPI